MRRGAAIAFSALLHLGALAFLALNALSRSAPAVREPPQIELVFSARPRSPAETPAAAAAANTAPRTATRSASTLTPAAPPPPSPAVAPSLPLPPPPAPSTGSGSGPPPSGAGAAGMGAGAGVSGDMRGALRGLLGCAPGDPLRLSPGERARCDQRLGEVARTAPRVDPIPTEKRAYYDAVAAAYAAVREGGGTPGRVPVGPPGPQRGQVNLYIPAVGCLMRFGAPRGWKSYHDRPPHSLKLGRLPCFITPPQAAGTEESGVEATASLRERADDAAHMKALDVPPRS